MEFSDNIISALCCPVCQSGLSRNSELIICTNKDCGKSFPIINNIPIFINEENSVFSINDFMENRETTRKTNKNPLKKIFSSLIPGISNNIKAKRNYSKFVQKLSVSVAVPKVLVLGSGDKGKGIDAIFDNSSIELYESDVSFGPRTKFIIDAHNIPFVDEYFDAVIIQAVLEHVVDPYKCVNEIYRVLKKKGFVYAETPFMQQVHEGKFDFHRFTHLGHRRLFRNFTEIESGAVCGPGMALAWSYSYFIFSFFSSRRMRKVLRPFTNLTSFFLKYFDYLVINKPGVYDAASGYYFWGQKSEVVLSDRDLLKHYKGLLQ